MRLLLDTHALLYWLDDPALLQSDARIALANPQNHVFFSPISIVEIVIKESRKKITVPGTFTASLADTRFAELRFTSAHALAMRELPPIHKDPFDRMLVAQSRSEQLTFVTRDGVLSQYDVPILAA
ncbi:MAG TPA: type II toxin-antitoxin system VapC family toxin [Pirellulales bacterium]|nr:type II toxin-antitoxin system VapC family toxin [Pirellulales bacterium]